MSESKIVVIKRKGQSRIPNEVYSDSIQKIGCGFIEGTRDIMRGLTQRQEELILPKIIGVPAEHVNFIDKAQHFYADLDIIVPIEGTKLNISTRMVKDGDKEIELPIVPIDYIQYKRCLIHSEVAKNKEEMDNSDKFKYYIEDETLELSKKVDSIKVRNNAQFEYLQLVAEDKLETNIVKITQILSILKPLHGKQVRSMKDGDSLRIIGLSLVKAAEIEVGL